VVIPARVREILAFLVVGGLSAGIDAGVYLVLTLLGVPPVLASAISFMSAFAVNYGGNRRVVFRATHGGTLWRYVTLVIVNLGLSAGLVALGIALGWGPFIAKAVSIVVIAAFNYVAMRQWVFRARPASPDGSATPSARSDSPEEPHSP
jgi:putative flippase GtrA